MLREEMSILEERFLARNPGNEEDEIGREPTDGTRWSREGTLEGP
jgi:hypothetical protein